MKISFPKSTIAYFLGFLVLMFTAILMGAKGLSQPEHLQRLNRWLQSARWPILTAHLVSYILFFLLWPRIMKAKGWRKSHIQHASQLRYPIFLFLILLECLFQWQWS